MASRASNFCIDAEECGLDGPDDRRTAPAESWVVLADPEGNEVLRTD